MASDEVTPEATPEDGGDGNSPGRNRKFVIIAVVIALIAGLAAVAFAADDDDEPDSTTTTSSSTTVPPTTGTPTTASAATATTAVPVDTSTAVWPFANSATRYSTPVDAARGFATDFAKFTNPVVGTFRQGDSRSGEVDVRSKSNGPATIVLVRQLNDNNWWVLGSSSPNIKSETPAAGTKIASPVTVKGTSTAYEAHVDVQIREDGSTKAIGTSYVMGGSMGEFGPFNGSIEFSKPTATYGAVIFFTTSAENGQVWEATTVRVRF